MKSGSVSISIGKPIVGRVTSDERGRKKVEGDMSLARWKDGKDIAAAVAKLLSRYTGGDENDFQVKEVLMEASEGEFSTQLEVSYVGVEEIDQLQLGKIAAFFVSQLGTQVQIETTETTQDSDMTATLIEEAVQIYKKGHSPRRLSHELVVQQGENILTVLNGSLIGVKSAKEPKREVKTVVGLFEGRMLRQRTMFLIPIESRGKSIEIQYDESKFDQSIRALKEDKNAQLKVEVCEIIEENGYEYLELLSMIRV